MNEVQNTTEEVKFSFWKVFLHNIIYYACVLGLGFAIGFIGESMGPSGHGFGGALAFIFYLIIGAPVLCIIYLIVYPRKKFSKGARLKVFFCHFYLWLYLP